MCNCERADAPGLSSSSDLRGCYTAPALALLNQVILCQRDSERECAPRVLLSTAVNEQITAFTTKALLCGRPQSFLPLLLEAEGN